MRRNCNLELRLVTTSLADYNGNINPPMAMDAAVSDYEEEGGSGSRQKLTIFYNGRIVTYDVTQCQARGIISLANQEMLGERVKYSPTTTSDDDKSSTTVVATSPVFSPNTALCMNKSLQIFLEKRKTRAQATSPY